VQDGGTFQTVWIDDTRYTREGDGSWKVERGAPAVPVPTYIWDSFRPYQDVRILGRARVDGVPTTEIAFAGGTSELPVWFGLWVDASGLVLQAEMPVVRAWDGVRLLLQPGTPCGPLPAEVWSS
jgi:hypothetical protein